MATEDDCHCDAGITCDRHVDERIEAARRECFEAGVRASWKWMRDAGPVTEQFADDMRRALHPAPAAGTGAPKGGCAFDGCKNAAKNCDEHSDNACNVAAGVAYLRALADVERELAIEGANDSDEWAARDIRRALARVKGG